MPFLDGLGERLQERDEQGADLALLRLRPELAGAPSFEFALRQQVSRLASFHHPSFARIRELKRADADAGLVLVSDDVAGTRLSEVLAACETRGSAVSIDAALAIIRQVTSAVAVLHEAGVRHLSSPASSGKGPSDLRNTAHGALAPERLILAAGSRVVIVEHVLGPALEQLLFSRDRYWSELRIALPRVAGLPRFDHLTDVTQIGVIALSLIAGRNLRADEYPSGVAMLLNGDDRKKRGDEPLHPALRHWIERALQLDPRFSFPNAIDARAAFEQALADSGHAAPPAAITKLIAGVGAGEPSAAAARKPAPVAVPSPPQSSAAPTPVVPDAMRPVSGAATQEAAGSLTAQTIVINDRAATSPAARMVEGADRAVTAPSVERVARQHAEPAAQAPVAVPPSGVAVPQTIVDAGPAVSGAKASEPWPMRVDVPAARDVFSSGPLPENVTPSLADEPFARTDERTTSRDAIVFHADSSPGGSRRWIAVAATVLLVAGAGGAFAARRLMTEPPVEAPTTTGTLVVSSDPRGAEATVDGTVRGVTPLSITLPAGAHRLAVKGHFGDVRSMSVLIKAGSQVAHYVELSKEAPLPEVTSEEPVPAPAPVVEAPVVEAGPAAGWISVRSRFDVQLLEHGQLLGDSRTEKIMVPAGKHELELVSEAVGYQGTRNVNVTAGKVFTLDIAAPTGSLSVNAQPWAEVWVDGERVGETPIGNLSIAIGPHQIVLRHPEFGERQQSALVTLKSPARISADMRVP